MDEPVTLHKYLYANANPVNYIDPSGLFTLAEVAAARQIRNTLATVQFDSYSYLISATINRGDYGLKDFLTDLAFGAAFATIPIVVPAVVGQVAKLTTKQKQIKKIHRAAKILYNLEVDDYVNRNLVRSLAELISDDPFVQSAYSRLQELDINVNLDFINVPREKNGNPIFGLTYGSNSPGSFIAIDIYVQHHNLNPELIASTLIHEATHAQRFAEGFPMGNKYEEYRAFISEWVYVNRKQPTVEDLKKIWNTVLRDYATLPLGEKAPF
ncbi:hypothetical protein [Spirulina sp. 06S082]|uniref:hypothetical protein n=1 Tax=Spirulina sp. 06S082 TaxID=3110248 RepID=UPI002B2165FD|nr:hypothetical protein [Spirulina sp. 06S082]MEA5472335.1 hypothetical protein [Spirulina sp. 06S082]